MLPVFLGVEGEHLYLVTPLCDTDLAGLLEERGRLDAGLAVTSAARWPGPWTGRTAADIVHRDVKPENILLVAGPAGLHAYPRAISAGPGRHERDADAPRDGGGAVAGVRRAGAVDGRAGVPATDSTRWPGRRHCCLTGHPPFWPRRDAEALHDAHLGAEPPHAAEPVDPATARVLAAIRRGLAKDPDDRYASCGALIAAARSAFADRPVDTAGTVADAPAGGDDTDPEHPFSARRGRERPPLTRARPDAPAVATADDGAPPAGGGTGVAAPAPAPEGGGVAARHRRRTRSLLAALGALLVLGVVAALLLGGGDQEAGGVRALSAVPSGARPTDAVAVGGTVWVANGDDGTLSPFDARSGRRAGEDVRALSNGFRLAAAGGTLWTIASSGRDVLRVDTQATPPVTTTRQLDADPYDIAADRRGAWIIAPGASRLRSRAGRLIALDLVTGAARPAVPTAGAPTAVATARGAVWVLEGASGIVESVDASAGRVRGRPRPRRRGQPRHHDGRPLALGGEPAPAAAAHRPGHAGAQGLRRARGRRPDRAGGGRRSGLVDRQGPRARLAGRRRDRRGPAARARRAGRGRRRRRRRGALGHDAVEERGGAAPALTPVSGRARAPRPARRGGPARVRRSWPSAGGTRAGPPSRASCRPRTAAPSPSRATCAA